MVIIIDLQCIGPQLWLVWMRSVTSLVWVCPFLPLYQTKNFANYFTYHLLLASYFGGHFVAPGNLTFLSIFHENFTFPFNLPESLAWVTLVTFFPDLEWMTPSCFLHRASATPFPFEKKVSFSLFFGKNPRSMLLTILLRALVVSKWEKNISRSFHAETSIGLDPIFLGEVAFSFLTYRDLILSFFQVISWILGL